MIGRRGLFQALPALLAPRKRRTTMTEPGNPVFGGPALRIPAICSPNFNLANPAASPAQSWALLQSGIAYFFGLVITGGSIIFPGGYIDGTGFFIYNGTPGLGTLIQSITPPSTAVDKFGNAIVGTNTTYQKVSPTLFEATAYQGNEIQFFTAASPAGPWAGSGNFIVFSPSGPDGILLNASGGTVQLAVLTTGVQVAGAAFSAGNGLAATGGTTTDTLHVTGTSTLDGKETITAGGLAVTGGTTTDSATVSGVLTATSGTAGSPSLVTTDTWHTAANAANITGTLQYRLNADNTVSLRGEPITSANTLANATLFTLPAGYRPTTVFAFITPNNFSGYTAPARVVSVSTAGVVSVGPAGTSGNFLLLDGIRFPVD